MVSLMKPPRRREKLASTNYDAVLEDSAPRWNCLEDRRRVRRLPHASWLAREVATR